MMGALWYYYPYSMAEKQAPKTDPASVNDIATREEKQLAFWKERGIFKKSLEKEAPRGEFVFYEGPPTANGRPGIHHLEARAFKDVIPRFKTMQGFRVRRKGGWDTHGLPVELQVEKELGLASKKDIEAYGIAAFNKKCKESVWTYIDEWKKFTDRIAFWIDLEHPYVTYDPAYMESVWHILKTVYDKGLVYKDYKVVPWCPRCGTALSSHELAQGYENTKDLSVTAKFKVKGKENTHLLAWTTTPWTLPGNVALAVGRDISYVKVQSDGAYYILAKERLSSVFSEKPDIVEEVKGSDLVGLEYEPLYDFIATRKDVTNLENAFKVYPADFVTMEDGTGIVHTAVMYGQDDFELGTAVGLPKQHVVGEDGRFFDDMGILSGKFVRDEETAVTIIKDLAHRGLLFKKEKYEHSYPHCWRCKTPLIYYARDSWYIKMSGLRDELVKENKSINWEPAYIKEGRFGEWLRDIKDWAISRERYWGTPIPLWKDENDNYIAIGSIEELRRYTKRSGNTYLVMRHGTADSNINGIVSADDTVPSHLTATGKEGTKRAAEALRGEGIEKIYVSPLARTKETADIVASVLNIEKENIIVDERIREINTGEFNGKSVEAYRSYFASPKEKITKRPKGGENLRDVKRRAGECLYDIESREKGKRILIITHEYVAWMLAAVAEGADGEQAMALRGEADDFIKNAEVQRIDFTPLPHNDDYELDLHRPYIDEIELLKDGKALTRISEVLDVWFDSGAMPYAQVHYPFDQAQGKPSEHTFQPKKGFLKKQKGYPADYISEAIDQTRGWFYTLHAIGVLLGYGKAYKNVICLGHILDEEGKKMSKSKGNVVNPWEMIAKYGVDALRFWMYSVNQPGESKNFDEKTVDEIVKRTFNLLTNTVKFYGMYKKDSVSGNTASTHILDRWILARLAELRSISTNGLEQYQILRPAREIREFVSDLSQWYIRRSRDRFKDEKTREEGLSTLRFVLSVLAKIMAPFTPFLAEEVYQEIKEAADPESVHLSAWPEVLPEDDTTLKTMNVTRDIVSAGLLERSKADIKVRQPLASVCIKKDVPEEFRELIKDELNVKEVIVNEVQEEAAVLDARLSEELIEEGMYRELVRSIQDLRKKTDLDPQNMVVLHVAADADGEALIKRWEEELKQTASLSAIAFVGEEQEHAVTIDKHTFSFSFA